MAGCILAEPSAAQDYRLGDLQVERPWARASIGQVRSGAAYFAVTNNGTAPDRLIAVQSKVADRSALHTHRMDAGVMRMRPVEAVEVAPGAPVVLRPGGLHVMLMGLRRPLEEGARFPLTLTFERAGKLEVEVEIRHPAAMDAGGAPPEPPGDEIDVPRG